MPFCRIFIEILGFFGDLIEFFRIFSRFFKIWCHFWDFLGFFGDLGLNFSGFSKDFIVFLIFKDFSGFVYLRGRCGRHRNEKNRGRWHRWCWWWYLRRGGRIFQPALPVRWPTRPPVVTRGSGIQTRRIPSAPEQYRRILAIKKQHFNLNFLLIINNNILLYNIL